MRRSVLGGQIGEDSIFFSPEHAVFADEPGLVPWKMLLAFVLDPLRRSVSDPHTDSGESELLSLPLVPVRQLTCSAIWHWPAVSSAAHRLGYPGCAALRGTAPSRNGPDQLYADRDTLR